MAIFHKINLTHIEAREKRKRRGETKNEENADKTPSKYSTFRNIAHFDGAVYRIFFRFGGLVCVCVCVCIQIPPNCLCIRSK